MAWLTWPFLCLFSLSSASSTRVLPNQLLTLYRYSKQLNVAGENQTIVLVRVISKPWVHMTNARYTYTCQAYLILNALKWLPKLLLSLPTHMLWSHHYGIFLSTDSKSPPYSYSHALPSVCPNILSSYTWDPNLCCLHRLPFSYALTFSQSSVYFSPLDRIWQHSWNHLMHWPWTFVPIAGCLYIVVAIASARKGPFSGPQETASLFGSQPNFPSCHL